MKKLILLVCFLFVTTQSYSANLFGENFSYTAGTSLPSNGWTALTGSPTILVTSPGLTFTDFNGDPYVGSGIGNAAAVASTGEDDAKALSSVVTSGSLYSSFMLNVTAVQGTGDYFYTLMTSGGANDSRLYARPATGGYNLGIEKAGGSGVVYGSAVYTLGQTYLVVVQYTFATPDEMSLYVFSSSDIVPASAPTPTLGPISFPLGTEPSDLNRVQLRQGSATNGPTSVVDGIYVETTWNNAVLPVELSSFTSIINKRDVTLNWVTASESNNSGFEIERASNNVWSKVGSVAGNGTTTSSSSYSYTDRGLATGNYNYRLKQIDFNGNFEYFNLSNEVNIGIPSRYELSQNYPNPFNPSTNINFDLPTDGRVSIKLFDLSGKEVATLVNEVKTAGYYSVNFNAAGLSSGIYFYNISANNFTATKKMTLIK